MMVFSATSSLLVMVLCSLGLVPNNEAFPASLMPGLCLRPKLALLLGSLCDPYIEGDVDCEVGIWTTWARHHNSTSGGCEEKRTRYIKKFKRGEGNQCPLLKETRQCVSSPDNGTSDSDAFNTLKDALGGFSNSSSRRRRRQASQACPPDRDIVLVVDSSGSVGMANFTKAIADLGHLIPYVCGLQTDLITTCNSTRVALVTYGQIPNLVFDLNDHSEKRHRHQDNLQKDIKQARYLSSFARFTATGDALQFTADRVLNEYHGMRQDSNKTILLLTDGQSNYGSDPVTVASELFKNYESKLAIIALGIGRDINYQELKNITNHQNLQNPLVILGSYQRFTEIVNFILRQLSKDVGTCEADILDKKKRK